LSPKAERNCAPRVANIPRDQRPAGISLRRTRLERRSLFADIVEAIHRLIRFLVNGAVLPTLHS
jgi:hypothetical protein